MVEKSSFFPGDKTGGGAGPAAGTYAGGGTDRVVFFLRRCFLPRVIA